MEKQKKEDFGNPEEAWKVMVVVDAAYILASGWGADLFAKAYESAMKQGVPEYVGNMVSNKTVEKEL